MKEKKIILVVDNSITLRGIIRKELESGGYHVLEAENGEKALDIITESSEIDMMTLHIDMLKLNGFHTTEELRRQKNYKYFKNQPRDWIPIIFVTSNDTIEHRQKGFELGSSEFITKLFNDGKILSNVNKILSPETLLKGLNALVGDDNQTARHIVTKLLEKKGVYLIEAEDGEDAFEILKEEKNNTDMLITDLIMKKMNGDVLYSKVRNELNLKELPIIFLTSMTEQSFLLGLFKSGGTDYLLKSFVKEESLARLIVHFEKSQLYKNLETANKELLITRKNWNKRQ